MIKYNDAPKKTTSLPTEMCHMKYEKPYYSYRKLLNESNI